MTTIRTFTLLGCLLFCFAPAFSAPVEVTISGNKADAIIDLGNGLTADLTLTFDQAVGLTEENLGLTAEIISVTDLGLLNRLPDPLNISLPTAFPMMITIEPPADGGLSFSGLATIDIHTHNLEYTAGTPLRFFKAPLNGAFKDITVTMGAGSYRARGTTGKFSQFIIAADLRAPLMVVDSKLTRLQQTLADAETQISAESYTQLDNQLSVIEDTIDQQDYIAASRQVDEFIGQVNAASLPNVWRSSRDIDNVSGMLTSAAQTLRFSLRLLN